MNSAAHLLIIRRDGKPDLRIVLPSLADALEAARVDASWLRGIGSVLVSPLDYNAPKAQKGL